MSELRNGGTRAKMADDFIGAVYQTWQAHGRAALERVCQEDPVAYLRLVAGLIPRQVEVSQTNPLEQLSDGELAALHDFVEALVAGRPANESHATH